MSVIERTRFAQDLALTRAAPSNIDQGELGQTLREAGLSHEELDTIAGTDHVISGQAEYEALYDKLVTLERAPAGEGGRADYARLVYDAIKPGAAKSDAPQREPEPLSLGSLRMRSTGVLSAESSTPSLTGPIAGLKLSNASYVRTLGSSAIAGLEDAAARDILGPESGAQRRIKTLTAHAAREIQDLETRAARLPEGSARAELERQIDEKVTSFENAVASEQHGARTERDARSPPLNAGERIKRMLPSYLRQVAEREGLVVPGAPGAIAPRLNGTPGFDWRLKF